MAINPKTRKVSIRLHELPHELLNEIFLYLEEDDRPTLFDLRLVCRYIEAVARFHLFRIIRLVACSDIFRNMNFLRIAKSTRLRPCVREVRIDTWGGMSRCRREFFQPSVVFMCVLPYLRFFHGLTVCHAKFSHASLPNISRKTRRDYSVWVLDVILNCLAGTWSLDRQTKIDDALKIGDSPRTYGDAQQKGAANIPLKVFTASELDNPIDKRILRSKAWHDLVDSKTLGDLKLYVIEDYYANTKRNALDLNKSLHHSWLTKNLGAKLRNLTLYWRGPGSEIFPPLTVPKVRPGMTDFSNYFPVLRSLLIGRYSFTTQDQADWVTYLGRGPGCNGLEELCIDDCRVLWDDMPQNTARYANTIGGLIGPHIYDKSQQPLRWYKMICRWATRLPNLKSFEMATADKNIVFNEPIARDIAPWISLVARIHEDDDTYYLKWKKTFRDFNIPEPTCNLSVLMRDWRDWCERTEWLSTRYCKEDSMVEGENRSIEGNVVPFDVAPWMALFPVRGWENECLLRLFDESALLYMRRLVEERCNPLQDQPILKVLSDNGPPRKNLSGK
ncbi:hypothetical protein B0T10DRAFT_479414 [Thelonectria olida]|uniref:F-box domain-containing protein n=1 Tax=Thelonectria olida TaxID=1576542 RepID=A0A9P8WAM2_9HYPO|nr:hypothetical protein B0T10DRAFT_479414 [Thelonectria olida]